MARKAKYRNIKSKKNYRPEELGEEVDQSTASIYRHISRGLPADKGVIPYLIYGRDAKKYFSDLYKRNKVKVSINEVQCNRCGKISAYENSYDKIISTGYSCGKNKQQAQILGICPNCNLRYSRLRPFLSSRKIKRGTSIPIDVLTGKCKYETV